MFKITNGGLLKRETTWNGLIFGSPKSGKTSLAASFSKPILIDLDHGAHRVASKNRAGLDVAAVENWADFEALCADDALKDYKTIVVDTFGAAVDMIIRDKFGGIMNPAKWGTVKSDIMRVASQLKMTGRSVLWLAHESEDKSDDKIIKRPQCQGKAKDELMKMLDFIGHTTKQGNDFVLEFGGDDSIYVGNTFGFKNRYVLPDIRVENNTFGRDVIETQIADFLASEEEQNNALAEKMAECRELIANATSADDFTKALTAITGAELTQGAILKLKHELADKATECGCAWNKDAKAFEKQSEPKAE
jgi:hypothetical protein